MDSDRRIKVFLAHGFGKERNDGGMSEIDVADAFVQFLKAKGFKVVTGEKPKADTIDTKIKERIHECDVVLGLFTRRWEVLKDHAATPNRPKSYTFPPYVLSECSYALGAYQNLDLNKVVGGFVEGGVEVRDLALVTAGGMEVLPFDRRDMKRRETTERINSYLDSIPDKLGRALHGGRLSVSSYRQAAARKVVSVYRNGLGIVKNTYKVTVRDVDAFNETSGHIEHLLYTDRPITLPSLEEMERTPIESRFTKPFFAAALFAIDGKPPHQQLTVSPLRQDARSISFNLGFGHIKKRTAILEYEYAWGMPGMFATASGDLREDEFNQVSLKALHGKINDASVEINFERSLMGTRMVPLFEISPFFQVSQHTQLGTQAFARHIPLPRVRESIWDETYGWNASAFDGSVRLSWRPK